MLKKGQWEFKNFNNLYTQNRAFLDLEKRSLGRRETYFSSINQFLYGINGNLNVGLDFWAKSVYVDPSTSSSPLQIFGNNGSSGDLAITGIGPKIKIAPFKKLSRLSIQSTFLIPLRSDLENSQNNQPFLEFDRYLWLTQIFYDKTLGNDFQLFFQLAPWYSFTRESFRENNFLETPASVFFSWFTNSRLTLYTSQEFWPTHYNSSEQKFDFIHSWFVQSGLGVKYQLVPGFLELEGSYTNFWLGSDFNGAGETFNFGFRIIN